MALIKCPECGRENVSDTAESCPECGYGIKAHFDIERTRELNKKIHEQRLNNVAMPEKPKYDYSFLFLIPIGLCGFVFGAGFGVVLTAIFTIVAIAAITSNYNRAEEKYNKAMEDFKKFKKEEVYKQEMKEIEEKYKPKCPKCNSTKIKTISTLNRATSVAIAGLASSKIGKQYECETCKHKW